MPIPVRCFTCGRPIADKYAYYKAMVDDRTHAQEGKNSKHSIHYFTADLLDKPLQKSIAGTVLDEMGIDSVCCRRHMLTHVDVD